MPMGSTAKSKNGRAGSAKARLKREPNSWLESLEITGFRGFDRVKITGLSPVTVITGKNGIGKTNLLEAILALHGRNSPSWVPSLQANRGFDQINPSTGPSYLGLFFGFKDSGKATIEGVFRGDRSWKLAIERSTNNPQTLPNTGSSSSTIESAKGSDLTLRTYRSSKLVHESALVWALDQARGWQLKTLKGLEADRKAKLMHPGRHAAGDEETKQFGDAKAQGRANRIIQGMKHFVPEIQDIELTRTTSGEYFAATVNGALQPLGLLGAGINHFFKCLVSLDSVRGGCLCIDEVENGLHFSIQEKLFASLIQFALDDGTQLVISTHSAEALNAIGRACEKVDKEKFSLVHLQQGEQISVESHVFRGTDAISAMRLGYELR